MQHPFPRPTDACLKRTGIYVYSCSPYLRLMTVRRMPMRTLSCLIVCWMSTTRHSTWWRSLSVTTAAPTSQSPPSSTSRWLAVPVIGSI
ncbi:hypothetical protein JG687_00007462 [Phytophthora cactorum]|uniref:Uncharacterized protein n=1 Tax=Phytophthora cactorum TaxID=29920 RepID=A0A8T1UI94_9STRA|nr:hypothetical protein JG687_00007462 [Phytophthora cactorum]